MVQSSEDASGIQALLELWINQRRPCWCVSWKWHCLLAGHFDVWTNLMAKQRRTGNEIFVQHLASVCISLFEANKFDSDMF